MSFCLAKTATELGRMPGRRLVLSISRVGAASVLVSTINMSERARPAGMDFAVPVAVLKIWTISKGTPPHDDALALRYHFTSIRL